MTTESETCIDHVITGFPIETFTIPLTISDHYHLYYEPVIPPLPCPTKENCSYCPKRRNLNTLKSNDPLNFLSLLNHYLGLEAQFSTVDEDTTDVFKTKKFAEEFAPEDYIQPTKVRNTWINYRLKFFGRKETNYSKNGSTSHVKKRASDLKKSESE